MSLSAIASTVKTNFVAAIEAVDKPTAAAGGGPTESVVGTTSAGAYMAQGSGAAPGGGSLVKKLLVGGVLGAGAGFAASFLPVAWITNLGPGGWAAKGIMAAAGAAIGVVGALGVHFIGKKKASLAMEAQAQQAQQAAVAQTPAQGETYRMGSKGDDVLALQKNLKSMGLFYPKVTGTFDKTTQNAIRRYEIMKGVQPTGLGSPDVLQAVAQDSGLIKKLA